MKWQINGFYDCSDGDELFLRGELKATIVERDGNLYLKCEDSMHTEIYCGAKGEEADMVIRTFWTTVLLQW